MKGDFLSFQVDNRRQERRAKAVGNGSEGEATVTNPSTASITSIGFFSTIRNNKMEQFKAREPFGNAKKNGSDATLLSRRDVPPSCDEKAIA